MGCTKWIFAFAMLFWLNEANASCNMGQDAPEYTTLYFGRIKISQFPAGSLHISNAQGLGNGDRWKYELSPSNQTVAINFTNPGTAGGKPLLLAGSLKLSRPLRGTITERLTQTGCDRTITIDADNLKDAQLTVSTGNVANPFGGSLDLASATLKLGRHDVVTDKWGATDGVLSVESNKAHVAKGRLRLPGPTAPEMEMDLKSQQGTGVRFQFVLNNISARITQATFQAENFVFSPTASSETAMAGLSIAFSRMKSDMLRVIFDDSVPALSAKNLAFVSPRFTHQGRPRVQVNDVTSLQIGALNSGLALLNGSLSLKTASIVLTSLSSAARKISFLNDNAEPLATASGTISLPKVSDTDINGSLQLAKPKLLIPGLSPAMEVEQLSLSMNGPKATTQVSAKGELSTLSLGGFNVAGRLPFAIDADAAGSMRVRMQGSATKVTLGRQGSTQIKGDSSNLQINGTLKDFDHTANAIIELPAQGMTADVALTQASIPALGGAITLDRNIRIANPAILQIGKALAAQMLDLRSALISLEKATLKPIETALPQLIQSAPAVGTPDRIQFSLDLNAPYPFGIDAKLQIPGFELKPPPPITSITFKIGNLDIETQSFKVERIDLNFRLSEVEVSLINVAVGFGGFAPHVTDPAKGFDPPDIRGRASTPLVIQRASVTIPFTEKPLEMASFQILGASFEARDIVYAAPDKFTAQAAKANVNITTYTKEQMEAAFSLSGAHVAAAGTIGGTADVDSVVVKLKGKPEKPDGSVAINISQLALAGSVDIPITIGCGINVPAHADIAIHGIAGVLGIKEGVTSGFLDASYADEGKLEFSGEEKCEFDRKVVAQFSWNCQPWGGPPCSFSKDIGSVRYRFAVYRINVHMTPGNIRFKLEENGKKIRVCRWSLDRLQPYGGIPGIGWSLNPVTNFGGTIGEWVNRAISAPFGVAQSLFAGDLQNLISLISFTGYGMANPIADDCLQ